MTDQNTYAIIGMCAIVITLYAIKESHTHYLPDLLGLALAFTTPRQSMAIGAVIILAIIRHTSLAGGLVESIPSWLMPLLLPAAHNMSIESQESIALENAYKQRISLEEMAIGNEEKSRPVAEISAEDISSVKTELLATAVITGVLGITEATRLGSGAQSGRKYQVFSRRLKIEIDRQRNHYVPLDENKQQKVSRP